MSRLTADTSLPIWQQVIAILWVAIIAFLAIWFSVHGQSMPDWIAAFLGIFGGFVAHALGVNSGTVASNTYPTQTTTTTPAGQTTTVTPVFTPPSVPPA